MAQLATVHRSDRVADKVYETLQQAILNGALAPGARLSVPALAQQLGVSRSPVREAVQRLIQDQLAREQPQGGAVVASIGPADLVALYEVREVLEGRAAALAVRQRPPGLLDQLRTVLTEHEAAVAAADVDGHVLLDMRFHALIRDGSRNRHVQRMLGEIQMMVRLAMLTTTATAGPELAVRDHRRVLAALEAGDPDRAETAARQHIARLRAALG